MTSKIDGSAAAGVQPTASAAQKRGAPRHGLHKHVTCPFCGIHCDDLEVESSASGVVVRGNGCDKAKAGFERKVSGAGVGGATPTVGGKPATLEQAVRRAAQLIGEARLPAFGGLATDVEGMRAVMALADRSGGVVDHALSEAQFRNFKVLQSTGWITSTLTETRNRADLIVIVGSDIHKVHPRFFERVVNPKETMFELPGGKRSVVFIGSGLDQSAARGPLVADVTTIDCPLDRVGDVASALRMVMAGRPLAGADVAGVPVAALQAFAERLRKASYPVFVWAPPSLTFPDADLAVQSLAALVRDLNVSGRAAGLSLGGNEGAVTAGAVCAWQSGYPLRVSYETGEPVYDDLHFSIARVVARGETDLLVCVASYTPDIAPPPGNVPTILIGTPGHAAAATAAVFIPVGTPGVDHAGRIIRCDNVVSLPLRDLGRSDLPSVEAIVSSIEAAL